MPLVVIYVSEQYVTVTGSEQHDSTSALEAFAQAVLTDQNLANFLITTEFGRKLLAENNKFKVIVENESDLTGLPPTSLTAAAELASKNGYEGK